MFPTTERTLPKKTINLLQQSKKNLKTFFVDRFRALGTDVEFAIISDAVHAQRLFLKLKKTIERFEQRFSRFIKSSELSLLNAHSGSFVAVSDEMFELFLASRRYWKKTKGIFDPTIANSLIQAGYDSSFGDSKEHEPNQQRSTSVNFGLCRMSTATKTVFVPKGVSIDFGGIGKGFLLDQLYCIAKGTTPDFCISLGGDLIVSGLNQEQKPWNVRIQDPCTLEHDQGQFVLPAGTWGIATSGIAKRKGIKGGVPWHHLIDPRTQKPSQSDVAFATVIAPTALQADIYAKTTLLLGSVKGMQWIQEQSCEALVVTRDGNRHMTTMFHNNMV